MRKAGGGGERERGSTPPWGNYLGNIFSFVIYFQLSWNITFPPSPYPLVSELFFFNKKKVSGWTAQEN